MGKSAEAFRTISEVADWLGVPAHVLRFWESKFTQVKPVKRAGGRRYYRPADMRLLGGIRKLLHDDGMTIKGVQKSFVIKGSSMSRRSPARSTIGRSADMAVDVVTEADRRWRHRRALPARRAPRRMRRNTEAPPAAPPAKTAGRQPEPTGTPDAAPTRPGHTSKPEADAERDGSAARSTDP